MSASLSEALSAFFQDRNFGQKGSLCVALVVTDHARKFGLPLDPESLLTSRGGQVLGLGKGAVQKILRRHGISRVLASEGGRTSRGSIDNMRAYVDLLNELYSSSSIDLDVIEAFWIGRVQDFFAAKPFKVSLDPAQGLRSVIQNILEQAEVRRRAAPGTQYVGAVMQHLVGAKLDCALGKGKFEHNSFSTSDVQSGRVGDFRVGDVAIHVTAAPGESVIERCRNNLRNGLRPVLVTTAKALSTAEFLAGNLDAGGRIDVFGIEQFIALNLYELGQFTVDGQRLAIHDLVERYNEIVRAFETDHSICIEVSA